MEHYKDNLWVFMTLCGCSLAPLLISLARVIDIAISNEIHRYPITFPCCIILTVAALAAFVAFLVLSIKNLSQLKKIASDRKLIKILFPIVLTAFFAFQLSGLFWGIIVALA